MYIYRGCLTIHVGLEALKGQSAVNARSHDCCQQQHVSVECSEKVEGEKHCNAASIVTGLFKYSLQLL